MKEIQSNGFLPIIAQAIAEMEELHGEFASINEINLAELGRRTGISQAKLRRLKANGFCETPHGPMGQPKEHLLDGYTIGRKGYSGPMDTFGYFACSIGEVSSAIIQKYIKNQG